MVCASSLTVMISCMPSITGSCPGRQPACGCIAVFDKLLGDCPCVIVQPQTVLRAACPQPNGEVQVTGENQPSCCSDPSCMTYVAYWAAAAEPS